MNIAMEQVLFRLFNKVFRTEMLTNQKNGYFLDRQGQY